MNTATYDQTELDWIEKLYWTQDFAIFNVTCTGLLLSSCLSWIFPEKGPRSHPNQISPGPSWQARATSVHTTPPQCQHSWTLSLKLSPATPWRKSISAACIHSLTLSLTTQNSWQKVKVWAKGPTLVWHWGQKEHCWKSFGLRSGLSAINTPWSTVCRPEIPPSNSETSKALPMMPFSNFCNRAGEVISRTIVNRLTCYSQIDLSTKIIWSPRCSVTRWATFHKHYGDNCFTGQSVNVVYVSYLQ